MLKLAATFRDASLIMHGYILRQRSLANDWNRPKAELAIPTRVAGPPRSGGSALTEAAGKDKFEEVQFHGNQISPSTAFQDQNSRLEASQDQFSRARIIFHGQAALSLNPQYRPLHWLGTISYSLYLTHVVAFDALVPIAAAFLPLWAVAFVIGIGAMLLSWLVDEAIEAPIMKLASSRRGPRLATAFRPLPAANDPLRS